MISINENDVLVGKRLISVAFNSDGSIKQIDSTDCIYESFEDAFHDIEHPIKILYGGITDDTVSEEFRGKISFKRKDYDENSIGHSMTLDIYRGGKRKVQYSILSIVSNKLQFITYRSMFIKPFNIDKFLVCRADNHELSVKKSLDLALAYIDTYLLLNPGW